MSEKRKAYQRAWIKRKRALLKARESDQKLSVLTEKPVIIPEGCTPIGVPDFSCCPHCRSKHISRVGNVISCRACGVMVDLSVGFVEDKTGEEIVL